MQHIWLNAIVYGIVAGAFVYFLAYFKILHVTLGAFFVAAGILAYFFAHPSEVFELVITSQMRFEFLGLSSVTVILSLFVLVLYFGILWILTRYFPDSKRRDLVGIIMTLSLSVFLENVFGWVLGSGSVSSGSEALSTFSLVSILFILMVSVYYFFRHTFLGKVFAGILESESSIRTLGFERNRALFFGAAIVLCAFGFATSLVLHTQSLRAVDGLFYLIVGVAILVANGARHIHLVFLTATLYAGCEYLLFVVLDAPIAYKAAYMLASILLLILLRPEGIYTAATRKI